MFERWFAISPLLVTERHLLWVAVAALMLPALFLLRPRGSGTSGAWLAVYLGVLLLVLLELGVRFVVVQFMPTQRAQLERAGLVRRNDRGHAYDFFRGRLVIPIQDLEGRVVGFGARQIDADARGPKYVNSPETELFRKSRLVYGLDRAL